MTRSVAPETPSPVLNRLLDHIQGVRGARRCRDAAVRIQQAQLRIQG